MFIKSLILSFMSIFILSCQLAFAIELQKSIQFSVTDQYNIGGDGRWDLLNFDTKHHHLFISRSSHVQVMDADSGKVVGDILGTEGVHGIAIAKDLNLGFTSNGKSNSVTVFDLTTLDIIENIKVSGLNPDAILYEPLAKHLFVFNGQSSNATVIDAVTRKQIDTIQLPGKPELAVSNEEGNVFVNIEDKSEIVVIDVSTNKLLKTFALGSGEEPTGLAMDKAHHRLFSVCANNKVIILDSNTGGIVSELPIGSSPDSAEFDPSLGVAFSSNGEGTLSIIKENDPEHFVVLQNLITQKGARTMAYDLENHRAYIVTASFGETPLATKEQPKPRPVIIPNSFTVLVVTVNSQK